MHSSLLITIIIMGNIAFAAAGVIIARKSFDTSKLSKNHQVGGYFLSVVGVLYALVLGLLIGNVHGKFDKAALSAQVEADACSDIWNFSRGFPIEVRANVASSVKEFYVVEQTESWERIAAGREPEASVDAYNQLWQRLLDYQPEDQRAAACYQSCLSSLHDLSDARSFRFSSKSFQQEPFVWAIMLIGGVLIVIFTFLFFFESGYVQVALTALVAAFIALNLLIVETFQHSYRNDLHIQSQAFSFKPEVFHLEKILNDSYAQQEK